MEDRIGEILIALYEASYSARMKRLEREERERQAREEERKREQIRKNYDKEVENTQTLVSIADTYIFEDCKSYLLEDRTMTVNIMKAASRDLTGSLEGSFSIVLKLSIPSASG